MRPLPVVAAVAALAFSSLPADAHVPPDAWSTGASAPWGLEGSAGAWVGGRFLVSHGYSGGDHANAAEYDPLTDLWTPILSAAIPRSELVGAAVGTKYYAIGGRGACGATSVCDAVEVYDAVSATWSTAAPLPTPRAGLGAAVVGTNIYVIGGRPCPTPYCGPPLGTLEIYDTLTNTWSTGLPMPLHRLDVYSVTALGPLVFVAAGHNGVSESGAIQVYDTLAGNWAVLPPVANMPIPVANAVAAACGGHLYVIGGTIGGVNTDHVQVLDVVGLLWSLGPPLPTPASEMAAGGIAQNPLGLGPGHLQVAGSGIYGASGTQNHRLACG